MSKVQLAGNASGTGIFTIASPNSNTDRTLTLPNQTGTLLTNASTAGFPAGSVLQVVNATSSGATTTTSSGTYVSTALNASITPSSATSKILIFVNYSAWTSTTNMYVFGTIYRNDTTNIVSEGSGRLLQTPDSGSPGYPMMQSNMYLDSPATTSSTSYRLYIKVTANTGYAIDSQSTSTITLMEIAA